MFEMAAGDNVLSHELSEFRIIYDRRSGQTHLLTPDLAAVLDALGEGPANVERIVERLSRSHDLVADEGDVAASIAVRLSELVELALADQTS